VDNEQGQFDITNLAARHSKDKSAFDCLGPLQSGVRFLHRN
jgi:hypothetical protein